MSVLTRRRLGYGVVAAVAGIAIAVSLISLWTTRQAAQNQAGAESTRADNAVATAEGLCAQVRALGGACSPESLEPLRGPAGEQGPAGPAGADGRGIVSASCTGGRWAVTYTDGTADWDAGPCLGEPGPAGPSGPAGEDGEDGVDGAQGPAGPAGADGRSISDVECRSGPDGWRWTVTYSDGTVDADAGPCYKPGPLG